MWTSSDESSPVPGSLDFAAAYATMGQTMGWAQALLTRLDNQSLEMEKLKQRVIALERWKGQATQELEKLRKLADTSQPIAPKKVLNVSEKSPVALDTKAALENGGPIAITSLQRSSTYPADPPPQRGPQTQTQTPPGPPPGLEGVVIAPQGILPPPEFPTRSQSAPPEASPESITIQYIEVDGQNCPRIEWRIENVRMKLRSCAGKPLVSPPFEAQSLSLTNLRLMVFPGAEPGRQSLRTREQKSKYEDMITNGPLHGALKFKVTSAGQQSVLKFNLFVGKSKKVTLVHNFAEHVVQGCDDFKVNWLEQVEGNGSLIVGVELLDAQFPP